MDVEMQRRKVISDNIANADTPHFKRSEVSFEASLRRAMDSEKAVKAENFPAKMTEGRHIPFFKEIPIHSVRPRMHVDYLTSMRNDGNNVDMEREVQDTLKNQLRYQALTQLLTHNNRTMNLVLRAP